ncbi:sugar nucleotide-binding protein [Polyangium aurulentum]|uniref:sugar nucleotide-binding protein n=1 Tax=Polyangium aurulentum TaxID=2567896 RepID=UPI0010AE5DA4|nr:sugar nucleotide-binding protein [Polyangium aurulentum]UQA57668.1 sugar nucleotide-binding protein [Polyangium aurulentum]
MKALITGARGTVGTRLSARLTAQGHAVVAWNRAAVPIDDYHAMEAFVRAEAPDVVYHLAIASHPTGRQGESWLVNYEWSSELAWITRVLGIRFVFTSTAMVFSNHARGPFTRDSVPDAPEGYGYEKRRAEERVRYQNPDAVIARLGWQIGEAPGSNNMIDFLVDQSRKLGYVPASTRWYPATSFLEDTAGALISLAQMPPDTYMIDSNECWTFYEIASALARRHGDAWRVVPTSDFVYDQRMQDPRVPLPSLAVRLPRLP